MLGKFEAEVEGQVRQLKWMWATDSHPDYDAQGWGFRADMRLEKLKPSNYKVRRFSRRPWRCIWCLTAKCVLQLPIIVSWPIWRTSHRITHSQAHYRLSTMARPPIPILVSQKCNLTFQTPSRRRILTPSTNRQPYGRHNGVYFNRTPISKISYDDIKEAFLLQSGTLFISQRRN